MTPPVLDPRRARLALFGLVGASFADALGATMILPVVPLFLRQAGASYAEIGLVAAAFWGAGLLVGYPIGRLSDRLGRKRLLVISQVVYAAATATFALSPSPLWFLALRALQGGAAGAANVLAMAAVADVVVLAVKPQVLKPVATALAEAVQKRRPLIISIAAGVRTPAIARWLGGEVALVRAMPNTPALVASGATALYATAAVSPAQRALAESILRAVGLTLWLEDEAQMDAVTALSGSGPAYFFLVMEALEEAAVNGLELPRDIARLLTLQTAFGAAKMALESAEDMATLRARVTSPGGTTERAVEVLENGRLRALFAAALAAARQRSIEIAERLGE